MTNTTQKSMSKDRTSHFIGDNKARLMDLALRLDNINSSVSNQKKHQHVDDRVLKAK
jgi:hypothetical protein|tara:strand:- start:2751 stop:2921 length:171 start_codon:yes stop_codon:yes gene_type:complete